MSIPIKYLDRISKPSPTSPFTGQTKVSNLSPEVRSPYWMGCGWGSPGDRRPETKRQWKDKLIGAQGRLWYFWFRLSTCV